MLRLDYLSCALTILSTVLVARKLWMGLVVAGFNSLLICLIGLRTSQFGFIPANLFCIAVYVTSLRSWLRPDALKPAGSTPHSRLMTRWIPRSKLGRSAG